MFSDTYQHVRTTDVMYRTFDPIDKNNVTSAKKGKRNERINIEDTEQQLCI